MAAVVKKRKADPKPVCKYGATCYRKNPQHIKNFRHPGKDEDSSGSDDPPAKTAKVQQEQRKGDVTKYFKKETKGTKEHDVSDGSDEETTASPCEGGPNASGDASTSTSVQEKYDPASAEEQELEEEDDDPSPESPQDVRESIKNKFLMDMPEDFYQFWEFCKARNPAKPHFLLKALLNLSLGGPFDILCGRHKGCVRNKSGRRPNFLLHHRYHYDPPEFQTVIVSQDKSQFHLGYYRDDPQESPVFVASNSPGDTTNKEKLHKCGDNLFAAVHIYASKEVKSLSGEKKKQVQDLLKALEKEAGKYSLSLAGTTEAMKARQKNVVCPTFHGAGIVVPVDDNEVGYRPVPETPGDLRAMMKGIAEAKSETEKEKHSENLQELITLIQFANDECDYGEGLELGLDLFSFGHKVFHPQIAMLLPLAYQLLNRQQFSDIIEAHLKHRSQQIDQLAV